MSWILVTCLLGVGGVFPETQSMDGILEINEKLFPEDDPASSFLSEGDIVRSVIGQFSPKLFLWPWVNKTVVIPYYLSDSYDEHQRNVIFEAFKDFEASTCIRFVEHSTQRDYISILPGSGCYSSVGRVGKRQVLSLAFQCVERGKGVVLHELMHVIGFWHEHSRADRDEYVTIHWNAIRKEYWSNFCKYETTNMVVTYDLESLLHYSSIAFSKSGDMTIEPLDSRAHMGQRIKLSNSDILRVNKLYRCPQYVPSEESLMAASLSSKELHSVSPPTEKSKTSPVALYSSLEAKAGAVPTSFSSQESKIASTGFMYFSTQEPTRSITGLSMHKGRTGGTAAPESIQDNSSILISHRATEQPSTGTAGPASVQDNSTVANPPGATKQLRIESARGTAAAESTPVYSTVLVLHRITEPSSRGTAALGSMPDNSAVLNPHRAIQQPFRVTVPEDHTTVLGSHRPTEQPSRGNAAPEAVHKENSTLLIPHGATEQNPRGTSAPESVQEDSTVLIPEGTSKHLRIESTRGTTAPEFTPVYSTVLVLHRITEQPSRGTAAAKSMQDNSAVLIPDRAIKVPFRVTSTPESVPEDHPTGLISHRPTEQPSRGNTASETVLEDSTVLFPPRATEQPSKGTSAPKSVQEDNSTALIPQGTTKQRPIEFNRVTSASESVHKVNSTDLIPHKVTEQPPIESTRGTRAHESIKANSTGLFPQGVTKHQLESSRGTSTPETLHKDDSMALIQHEASEEPSRGMAAPESVQENNSTVLITQNATNPLSDHSTVFTTVSAVGSSVTNLKLNMSTGDRWGIPLETNRTAFLRSNFTGEENGTEDSTIQAIFESKSSDSITVSAIREDSLIEAILPTSIFMLKRTLANIDVMEENPTLETSSSSQSSERQLQATAEDTGISSDTGVGLNGSQHQDDEHVKENLLLNLFRKRSLAGKTLGSWSGQHPRWHHGNKLTNSYNNRRKRSSEIIEPVCGFEHGFCGWKQSTADDLDWRLSWGSLNANVGHFGHEGFHLSLKSSPEESVLGQKALLLRPIVQPSNCISFWYSSRNRIMGTLNVYITSSAWEQTLLWTSANQDHVKWTKAQIMLPAHLLYNNAYVVVEGVMGPSDRSNIAIDDLYVGQCH